jgi:hypothetical protein
MSLQSDIADYRAEHAGILHVTERFYRGLPFADAIRYGASAAGPYGKIDPHQRRIGVRRLRRAAEMLARRLPEIGRAGSFADLFVVTEEVRLEMRGLGHLWSYDTALRIAFNRGTAFYPQAVFVQRGVVKGVRKIFTRKPANGRTLPVDIFPKELQQLQPFELENFLCVWGKQINRIPISD